MFPNKIFALFIGYLLGNFAAYIYGNSKKKPKKIKDESDLQAMFDAFLQTQKNIASDIENKYSEFDPKKRVGNAKSEMLETMRKYIAEGQKVFQEIKSEIQDDLQAAKSNTTASSSKPKKNQKS